MRLIAPTLLILAGTICLGAAEEEPVRVKDFAIAPMANLGSEDGTTRVHVKAALGVGYDSNLFATEQNTKDDSYLRSLAGFEIRHQAGEATTASLDVYINSDNYADFTERDLLGGRAIGAIKYEGETARYAVAADFEHYDDPLVQTGQKIKRETYGGIAAAGWETPASKGGFTLDVHRTEYLEDAGGFVAEDRNVWTSKLGFRYAFVGGEDSENWLRVVAGSDTYDTNNRLQDDMMGGGYIGWKLKLGERAKLSAEVGGLYRHFSHEFLSGYDDEIVVLPEANLVMEWPWNDEGSLLNLRGYTRSDTSLTSNVNSISGLAASVRCRATQQFVFLAGLEGMLIADTASAPGTDPESRSTGIANLGVEYHAMDGFALRLIGRETFSEAAVTTSTDYNRSEVILETAVVF